MAWRYHIQRAISDVWLDRDAQLRTVNLEWALSGPGGLTAELDAISAEQIGIDGILMYDEWSTIIYAEEDDIIRWAGIVDSSADIGNGEREITAISFSGYPTGRIYTGELRFYQEDGFDLIRMLWQLVQEDPQSDLGVILNDELSGILIGSEDPGSKPEPNPGEDAASYEARVVAWQSAINEPYELNWWNTPDYGAEIDGLLADTSGEYVEYHSWVDSNKTGVKHNIDLYYMDAGSRRFDLRFVEGENVIVPPLPQRDGSTYANYVVALGAGEDRHTLRHESGRADNRLRRDFVLPIKDTYSPSRLARESELALDAMQQIMKYDTVEVFDHPNANIGSWSLGDDIFLETHSGYEKISDWARVVGWSIETDNPDRATLKLVRIT